MAKGARNCGKSADEFCFVFEKSGERAVGYARVWRNSSSYTDRRKIESEVGVECENESSER